MPKNNLENLSFMTKISFLFIAIIAGIVHFGKRDLSKKTLMQKILLFIYDCSVAGSISVFTGLIVLSYTDDVALSLGIGGILGHLGNRVINIAEIALKNKLGVK